MKFIVLHFVIFFASFSIAYSQPYFVQESKVLPSGTSYELTIKEISAEGIYQTEDAFYGWWGLDGGEPEFIVGLIEVKINSKKLLFPQRFYNDICHLNKHSLNEKNGEIYLNLEGGDAAGSFNATYKFNKSRITERIIRHGEVPNEIWEKTVFIQKYWDESY